MNEAIRDWVANVETTHYLIGSAAGPHPYPTLVRELQSVIGARGARAGARAGRPAARRRGRLRRRRLERDRHVPPVPRRRGRAAASASRRAATARDLHAALARRAAASRCCTARARYVLADERRPGRRDALDLGRASTTRASGPSTRTCKDSGRAEYVRVTDDEALEAFHRLCRLEGIIPALESSHALARAERWRASSGRRRRAGRPLGPRRQGRRHRAGAGGGA